jgi:prephenate dehydrogenase
MARRPHVAIVGLGLVGGSLARALTAAGYTVTGIDWPLVVRRALRTRAISRGATRTEKGASADVVVLAAPPATNLRLLRRLAKVARPGLVITDVSSVKGDIVREAARLGLDGFVGGHPMAGTEKQGFSASSAGLFRGAAWWIVPGRSARATRVVRSIVRAAGARAFTTDAATHDRTMAFLSHVPQVVSWALLEAARGDAVARRHVLRAGPGFRGMTRLARSPRALWQDILEANRVEVRRALRALVRRLERSRSLRRDRRDV